MTLTGEPGALDGMRTSARSPLGVPLGVACRFRPG